MKPTKEQIEHYIHCADLELGMECCDDWVEEIRSVLRGYFNEPTSVKVPRPEGHDSWSIEIKTAFGGGGGGGSYPDTGETTSSESNSPT